MLQQPHWALEQGRGSAKTLLSVGLWQESGPEPTTPGFWVIGDAAFVLLSDPGSKLRARAPSRFQIL